MRRDGLLLEDIVAAADAVAEFIAGYTAETLASNQLVRSAVVHQLTVIGEAVARLSAAVRDQHPEIPWTDIKGLRNVVVHNYFGIDWAEVWSAASTDVPVLRSQLLEILRECRQTD
jgi:uncharacterized protein with HEPN domain